MFFCLQLPVREIKSIDHVVIACQNRAPFESLCFVPILKQVSTPRYSWLLISFLTDNLTWNNLLTSFNRPNGDWWHGCVRVPQPATAGQNDDNKNAKDFPTLREAARWRYLLLLSTHVYARSLNLIINLITLTPFVNVYSLPLFIFNAFSLPNGLIFFHSSLCFENCLISQFPLFPASQNIRLFSVLLDSCPFIALSVVHTHTHTQAKFWFCPVELCYAVPQHAKENGRALSTFFYILPSFVSRRTIFSYP